MSSREIHCTILFADVAGSTTLYEKLGDIEARERLSKALNSLISITHRHRGELVKTIGDEIMVFFRNIDMALKAAMVMQETMEDDRSPETVGVSIRVGMHYGAALIENGDLFGDSVNVAARVAEISRPGQILLTKETAALIQSSDLTTRVFKLDTTTVKGRRSEVELYTLRWEEEGDVTNLSTASNLSLPSFNNKSNNLVLSCNDQEYPLEPVKQHIVLGRGKDCQVITIGELVSRHHAMIEYRQGRFVIIDHSTNGTFVKRDGESETFLRRDSLPLQGSGVISLGRSLDKLKEKDAPLIHYQLES